MTQSFAELQGIILPKQLDILGINHYCTIHVVGQCDQIRRFF